MSATEMTLSSLSSAFSAKDIATYSLIKIPSDCQLTTWFSDNRYLNYDVFPVENNTGSIIGIYEKNNMNFNITAAEAMTGLDDSFLVASTTDLLTTLKKLDERGFLLVVEGTCISGIVTRSDVQKLPVRVYAFALITYIETLMALIIETAYKNETDWLGFLNSTRREKVLDKQKHLQQEGIDPSLIECCDFCDKRDLVQRIRKFPAIFEMNLKKIEKLRNSIAHAGSYISSQKEFREFIHTIDISITWIDNFKQELSRSASSKDESATLQKGLSL